MKKQIVWVAETSEDTPWNRREFTGRGAAASAQSYKKDIEADGKTTVSLYRIEK